MKRSDSFVINIGRCYNLCKHRWRHWRALGESGSTRTLSEFMCRKACTTVAQRTTSVTPGWCGRLPGPLSPKRSLWHIPADLNLACTAARCQAPSSFPSPAAKRTSWYGLCVRAHRTLSQPRVRCPKPLDQVHTKELLVGVRVQSFA